MWNFLSVHITKNFVVCVRPVCSYFFTASHFHLAGMSLLAASISHVLTVAMKLSCFSVTNFKSIALEFSMLSMWMQTSKITANTWSKKTRLCCCFFSLKVLVAKFPPKTPRAACGVIPVNWVILLWYACGVDGFTVRWWSRDYQNFSDAWITNFS